MSQANTASADVQVLPHSYDGIQEFDNRLPNWWLMTLFGAIVFGAAYWVYFETTGAGMTAAEDFEQTQVNAAALAAEREKAAEAANPVSDELFAALSTDAETVKEGAAIYATNCVACHAANGQGLVGPNLTDAYWIHGENNKAIFNVISNGVPAKGMLAWRGILGLKKTKAVTAYVVGMKGKNLPGKPPQGVNAKGEKAVTPK